MRPNLLNKFGGILLLKSPLNGRESGSIQEVLELRGIKTRTGFLNARQIAMPQDGTDARKTVVKILNQMLHSAADTQSHAETTWRTISSRANPQSSLSEMNLVKLDGFGYIPAFNNTPLTEALQEQAKIHINRQINTPAQLRADYRAARKC